MGRSAIVLGAGLQGVSVSLALARAGFDITLIDRAPDCLLGASLHNEGKIHLGLVYGNDRSGRTADLMLESARTFAPLLDEWTGRTLPWHELDVDPFDYLVLEDSLVPPEELFAAWDDLQTRAIGRRDCETFTYLGQRLDRLWWLPAAGDRTASFVSGRAAVVVKTAERAVHTGSLARLVRCALQSSARIRCLFGHEVRSVRRSPAGFSVEAASAGSGTWRGDAPVVVNCLWAGRLAIDLEMGVLPSRPWVHRLKYRLLGRLPARLAHLPSLTMMLGRFGDVVNYGGGRAYLSWYPTCLRGWSSSVEVPDGWRVPCQGGVPLDEARGIIDSTLEAFDALVPGLKDFQVESIAAGVIFSWGATDIHDLESELHQRADIGPAMHDGYITVNTGKFTSAPLFARRIVDVVS